MAIIGNFTRNGDGFVGTIDTLTVRAKAKLVSAQTSNRKGPDFRLFVAGAECGAAWKQRSDKGNDYLSVVLDDPAFAAPIRASLVGTNAEGKYALLWTRRGG